MADLETLQSENAELKKQLEGLKDAGEQISELRGELEKMKGINSELIETRDKLKEERRRDEQTRLEEQGEFKTLAEERQAEIDKLSEGAKNMQSQLEEYRKRDEERFSSLLEKVPEDMREELTDDIPLSRRLVLAERLAVQKKEGPGGRPPGGNDVAITSRAQLRTAKDKAAYIHEHGREAYEKLPLTAEA